MAVKTLTNAWPSSRVTRALSAIIVWAVSYANARTASLEMGLPDAPTQGNVHEVTSIVPNMLRVIDQALRAVLIPALTIPVALMLSALYSTTVDNVTAPRPVCLRAILTTKIEAVLPSIA